LIAEEFIKAFSLWIEEGNAFKTDDDVWLEHTTQWRCKFTFRELVKYFIKEFTEMQTIDSQNK